MKIYIALAKFEDFDNLYTKIFKVFQNEKDAQIYVDKANFVLKKFVKHINTHKELELEAEKYIHDSDKYEEMTESAEMELAYKRNFCHYNLNSFKDCFIEEHIVL